MTFGLSSESVAARDQVRAFAQVVQARAAEIDRTSTVPAELARELTQLDVSDALTMVITVEEIAVASAAAAMAMVEDNDGGALGLSGLRGARAPEIGPRGQLALAAIALGVGRAAMESALADVRQAATPTAVEKPQWLVADVATDLDAARLLTYKAARTMTDADIAVARLLASAAAQRAVDAAVRVAGVSALADGSPLERLSRDVRVLSVLLGTEEDHRATAAAGLLPR
jgi:hypothetical protein